MVTPGGEMEQPVEQDDSQSRESEEESEDDRMCAMNIKEIKDPSILIPELSKKFLLVFPELEDIMNRELDAYKVAVGMVKLKLDYLDTAALKAFNYDLDVFRGNPCGMNFVWFGPIDAYIKGKTSKKHKRRRLANTPIGRLLLLIRAQN